MSWQGLDFDFTGVVFDDGSFAQAKFSGGEVSFVNAEFLGGEISFDRARFSGGTVDFRLAEFSGGTVDFVGTRFSGGEVDFRDYNDWSSPSKLPWTDTPPPDVKLPKKKGQSET